MLAAAVYLLLVLSSRVLGQNASSTTSSPFTVYTLTAENVTAKIIPYGARVISLIVPDRNGTDQDIAVGYDNPQQYLNDTQTNHTYFGAVVGRYANRIKNGTFSLNGQKYHIPANENKGADTLHGGNVGYDARNWTVVSNTSSALALSLLDEAFEGFPGSVLTTASFSVSSYRSGPNGELRPRLTTKTVSVALDKDTPIMLSGHIYWNLNSFKAKTILNDTTVFMPYSDRYVATDGILIPNGTIGAVAAQPALDFTAPKLVGDAVADAQGVCGTNCTGIDNCFIIDRPAGAGPESSNYPILSVWSSITGIKMDVSTNQQGVQVYTCNGQNGTIPTKQSQQRRNNGTANAAQYVEKHGCIVIETQQWIDGINHPEWGVQQYEIFGPETGPAINLATYDFSTYQ